MSKIIDALKTREVVPPPIAGASKEIRVEKTSREITQEQLAEIYFSATGRPKPAEPPVIIKVIEKPRIASVVPWIITSLAFLITALSLFSTKRIFVDIKVVDDKTPYVVTSGNVNGSEDIGMPREAEIPDEKEAGLASLQEFVFEGAAYLKSSRERNLLTLVNSSVAPFARAAINFERPMDLRGGKIVFYAKGSKGGENLAIALKDDENNQAFHKGKVYPYPRGLTTAWQRTEIFLKDVSREFDLRKVASFRFEFGSKDTSNRPGDTILIKDLQWFSK